MKLFVGALARTRTDSYGRVVSSAVNGEDLPYASPGGQCGLRNSSCDNCCQEKICDEETLTRCSLVSYFFIDHADDLAQMNLHLFDDCHLVIGGGIGNRVHACLCCFE
jgi:hypothetical protein